MPAKWEFSSEDPPRLNSLRDKPGSDALKIIKFEMLKLNDFCFGKTCNAITHASMGSRKVLEFFSLFAFMSIIVMLARFQRKLAFYVKIQRN